GRGIASMAVNGSEVIAADGITLLLREDRSDTWTMGADRFVEPVAEILDGLEWTVEETGPLRARVRAEAWLGHSSLRWTLSVEAHRPSLSIRIEVNLSERHRLLQLVLALTGPVLRRTDGLVGGEVDRGEGQTEWPVQGWSRLQLPATAVAL